MIARLIQPCLLAIVIACVAVLVVVRPAPAAQEGDEQLERNQSLLERWRVSDPERYGRLQREFRDFTALTAQRQSQLRQLDSELNEQNSIVQQRLYTVMERYQAWLKNLPEADRKRIESASDRYDRLRIVSELRDREWAAQLPKAEFEAWQKLPDKQKSPELKRLREEERKRMAEWQGVPPRFPATRREYPVRLSDFPSDVQSFVRESLLPLLTSEERERLAAAEGKPWPVFARTLKAMADKHPVTLPGPVLAVRIKDLPPDIATKVNKQPGLMRLIPELQRQEGKWPEFGMVLYGFHKKQGAPQPLMQARFTPAHLNEMSTAVQNFLRDLMPPLTMDEQDLLKAADGKWPEYPKAIFKLARNRGLSVPGMTLPDADNVWDRVQNALPEVIDWSLRHFVMSELTPEDRKALNLIVGDPTSRERIKQEFFKRHPRELQRLQQLDAQGFAPKTRDK